MEEEKKLKTALKERGSTQKWLSEQSEVNYTYLSRYLNGRGVLSPEEMKQIAKVLGKKVSDLF